MQCVQQNKTFHHWPWCLAWFGLVQLCFWNGTSSQVSVADNMSQRRHQFTLLIHFWHGLLFAIVTLVRSNWISGFQYFWATDRHQETLHSIIYACRGKRTMSGESGTHWGYIRLPQRAADPPVMNRLLGCRHTLTLLGTTLYSFDTVRLWSHIIKLLPFGLSWILRTVVLMNSRGNAWCFKGHSAS